ncbi:MAG: hypothetical protein JO031_16610, partial [Ktedonobacteraceae bacterium]|nr:hypothetical protein [Ktedonobacteraceae bacterium]
MMWGKAYRFMHQQPALLQTTQPAAGKAWLQYRWMRHFFIEDTTTGKRSILLIQRRAVWIAVAFILQALSTTNFTQIAPFLKPFSSLCPLPFMLASFFAIWMALRPARSRTKIHRDERKQTTPTLWQRLILITTFGFAIG